MRLIVGTTVLIEGSRSLQAEEAAQLRRLLYAH